MRIYLSAAALVAGLSLSGCATNGLYSGVSLGYGSGYGSYGYGGYGYNRIYDPWYDPFYRSSYWGWYDNYYYPGVGHYVYDRWRRPIIWSDRHRRYWTERRLRHIRSVRDRPEFRQNWNDFNRARERSTVRTRIAPRSETRASISVPARSTRATRVTPRSEVRSPSPRTPRATVRNSENKRDD